jgi:anti-anti-sigma factor
MYQVRQHDSAAVIAVDGALDIASAPELTAAVAVASEGGSAKSIVVSLDSCGYCDASGLGVLVPAKKRLGSRLAIVVPRTALVRRVFELTGLTKSLLVYPELSDALRALDAARPRSVRSLFAVTGASSEAESSSKA